MKSVQLEETKKVESQCTRNERGRLLHDKGRIRERWVRFIRSLCQIRHGRSRHPEQTAAPSRECPWDRTHGRGDFHSERANDKREISGDGWPFSGTAETRTPSRSDHPAGAPSVYHPHLAREENPKAVEIRGSYRTPKERRRDGVRNLSRHLARVTRG